LACHLQNYVALSHFNAGDCATLGAAKDLTQVTSFIALSFVTKLSLGRLLRLGCNITGLIGRSAAEELVAQFRGTFLQGCVFFVACHIAPAGFCQGNLEGVVDPTFLGSAA
jgi:hypothetical protein